MHCCTTTAGSLWHAGAHALFLVTGCHNLDACLTSTRYILHGSEDLTLHDLVLMRHHKQHATPLHGALAGLPVDQRIQTRSHNAKCTRLVKYVCVLDRAEDDSSCSEFGPQRRRQNPSRLNPFVTAAQRRTGPRSGRKLPFHRATAGQDTQPCLLLVFCDVNGKCCGTALHKRASLLKTAVLRRVCALDRDLHALTHGCNTVLQTSVPCLCMCRP